LVKRKATGSRRQLIRAIAPQKEEPAGRRAQAMPRQDMDGRS
jgi:hypothetical protein